MSSYRIFWSDADVDREAPIGIANAGSDEATARAFHTHQDGGTFLGYPEGLAIGDWDMAFPDPTALAPFDEADAIFRLTRITAEPGAVIQTADSTVRMFYVEVGTLEQVKSGPGGEFVFEWPTGKNGYVAPVEGVEQTLSVVGDTSATVLEFSAIPQPLPNE